MSTNIENRILNLILDNFILKKDQKRIHERIESYSDIYNVPLTGDIFEINGTELVYLYFEIQKMFHIHFDAHQVCNYEFLTIRGIADLVKATAPKVF
ncbi:hypothetical protein [Allofournierella sp.]|uniref:hypothetical protein n=1 Tax=Allofournierella sp. TaxID=1940256 RepID=UPI003AB84CF4